MNLIFKSVSEERIGTVWKSVFNHGWPGWRRWYLSRREEELPTVEKCRQMLRRHMPGMERSWDHWVEAVDGDEDVARFLSFWSPPRYLVNCSQMAFVDDDGPVLIRNYDLDPTLNEATILKTRWHGSEVIGMVEGMAGLSDGMNRAGLAISLTFGGRVECQPGFGIPLIMRYVLETCRDVQDATAAFRAIPCHMSYNITMIDKSGAIVTLMLSPDRPVIVHSEPWATNHQLGVEWPRHGRLSKTLERSTHLGKLIMQGGLTADSARADFLAPPLHARRYDDGFGTVFTAVYRPSLGNVSLTWCDGEVYDWSFEQFADRSIDVSFSQAGSWAEPTSPDNNASFKSTLEQGIGMKEFQDKPNRWTSRKSLSISLCDAGVIL